MKFKDLFEAKVQTAEEAINSILKSKYSTANVKEFDGDLYFEMKDVQGTLRLSKKIGNSVGYGEINGSSGGQVGFYDSAVAAILGNKDAVAYIKLTLRDELLNNAIQLAKAKQVSNSEYKKNHKNIVQG